MIMIIIIKVTVMPIVDGALGTAPKVENEPGEIRDQKKNRHPPDHGIGKIG